ncbi:MAG: hypothetical protein WBF26_22050, partial [Candidatus Sulfotelmatobacter sp.]
EYHTRFGMRNQQHLRRSLEVLRDNGYTDCDLVDMYSVLQNRSYQRVDDILAGSTPSAKAPTVKAHA